MDRDSKIYIAGHRGLVGSAILRRLLALGFANIVVRTHHELDLTDESSVQGFFGRERPEYVFLAAAKVGGILANSTFPADFIRQNLAIQTNVIHAAYCVEVRRLLFLGSSCIYPKHAPQPIKEEYLLQGPLEPTNRPYATAKIAGIEMCCSYNRQHGTCFLTAMPSNLFGPGDRYDPQNSHVIPGILQKMHDAKVGKIPVVSIWGTGEPRREFLYSEDAANACVFLMDLPDREMQPLIMDPRNGPVVNVGSGHDVTIRELAELIAAVVGCESTLDFDLTKPDGTPRKCLDISRLAALGWAPKTSLRQGLEKTYLDFLESVARSPQAIEALFQRCEREHRQGPI